MSFHKYHSIKNINNINYIDDDEWIAMEKIDGSNLQFIITKDDIKTGRRNSLLEEDDIFCNFQKVRDSLRSKLVQMRELVGVGVGVGVGEDIIVYGEIFGGYYQKMEDCKQDYKQDYRAIAVQKNTCYCPDNRFCVFDIRRGEEYLNYDEMEKLCKEVDILYCEAIHRGSFSELKSLDPVFQTTFPQKFGFDEIKNNNAEGYVIRPVITKRDSRNNRVIFKLKAPSHTERSIVKIGVPRSTGIAPTERCDDLVDEIVQLICMNRLNNVISKMTKNNKPEYILLQIYTGKLIQDAIDEYCLENEIEIETNEKKFIVNKIRPVATDVINTWKKID
jgi:Rnl2 family RNA ligase